MKQPEPKPHFQFNLGAWAFEVLYSEHHQLSLLLYTALRTLSTRSYHHVSYSTDLLHKDTAISVWSKGHCQSPSHDKASYCQKAWDTPRVEAISAALLDQSSDAITRARLLAVSRKESGAWLHAIPNSSLGLRMNNEMIRVAVGLRLGVPLCSPHLCQHCGAAVDHFGLHGLSCQFSTGRHYCHAATNDIIH